MRIRNIFIIAVIVQLIILCIIFYLARKNPHKRNNREFISIIDSLNEEERILRERKGQLETQIEEMRVQLTRYKVQADIASESLRLKQQQNSELLQRNQILKDENNITIDNMDDAKLERRIVADYGNNSERCCP